MFGREQGGDPGTTTISTIAIRAGDNANIVVALLKSVDYVELRIDEMRPRLLAIGLTIEETSALLNIHEDLMIRLREKEDQVGALLTRADSLGSEKTDPEEAIVYEAMAKSLSQAWRELNKQLFARGDLLKETLSFYRMAHHHEQLAIAASDILRRALAGDGGPDTQQVLNRIEHVINELIDTTASAVDLGASVISQIRTIGKVNDNPERAEEIFEACVIVEKVMLKIANEWERVEATWRNERNRGQTTQTIVDELYVIEEWLEKAEQRMKTVGDSGQKAILEEGNKNQSRLLELGASGEAEGGRVAHLSGRIEEFLHYLKTRMARGSRIEAFFSSAASMISQLSHMENDMRNANAAMAGELAPLARQKAASVIQEGRDIQAKEILSQDEHQKVKEKCEEMERRLVALEELARQRQSGNVHISQELQLLQQWYKEKAEPFLACSGDMGGNYSDAIEFVQKHKEFATEIVNRDPSVVSVLSKKFEMSESEQIAVKEFEVKYEKLKDMMENRIQLGSNFEQVQKFAKELESSFDALTSLLDTNRDFTNERVAGQMNNVFQMIQETLGQERHQGEKFIVNAEQTSKSDETLDITRATTAVRNLITDHDHRFTYVTHKWQEWQQNKAELRRLVQIVEEIQMWQEETFEIIRLLDNTNATSMQETKRLEKRIKELRQTLGQQDDKIRQASEYKKNEQFARRVAETLDKQEALEEMVKKLEAKVETVYESFLEEESEERVQAPQILTQLKDAQVEEGSRFEFIARIEGEPEPNISWLKDGIDVKNNMDYRQEYINGVASLTIEETFIEDTATYTVRATNKGGSDESSAKLIVKSRSALSSLMEEDKPRFVKQLQNTLVTEGQTIVLDCVIVGKPEPQVIWHKEEHTVTEDDHRIKFDFQGDHCRLVIIDSLVKDTGLYTAKAKNIHGETTNFCQVKVVPKKQPPPTPPKPISRPSSVVHRPPSIQPTLTNSTWQEGDTVTLQVYTLGEPRPRVEWSFNDFPIQTSKEVRIEEQSDGWSRLIIEPAAPIHTGLYTVVAENEMGEARTGASIHIQPNYRTTTTEKHMQEDLEEKIGYPTQQTTEKISKTSLQLTEREPSITYDSRELSSISNERRWVDLVEDQLSMTYTDIPIPQTEQKKKTTTETRWVDEIDELLGTAKPKKIVEDRESHTAETYVKMVDDLMRDTSYTTKRQAEYAQKIQQVDHPIVDTTHLVKTDILNIGQIQQSTKPVVETSTRTTVDVLSVGQYQLAVEPIVEKSTRTTVDVLNVGQIQEVHPTIDTSTTTKTTIDVLNVGQIQEAPQPTVEKCTRTTVDVLNVGQIQEVAQPTVETSTKTTIDLLNVSVIDHAPQPTVLETKTTTTNVSNAAQIDHISQPEVYQTTQTTTQLENVGLINQQIQPEVHTTTQTTTDYSYTGQIQYQQPEIIETTKTTTTLESMGQIQYSSQPDIRESTQTTTTVSHVGQSHEAPLPESGRATMTPSNKMFNVATVRMSPQPESFTATTTQSSAPEHAATIRRTPVPEAYTATTTQSAAAEHAATIRQTPVPESHTATTTQPSAAEHAATIRQTPVPESHQATITKASSLENIAAIRRTPVPESHTATITSGNAVENIAAIRQSPVPETHHATTTHKTTESAMTIRQTPVPETQQAILTSAKSVENIAAIRQTPVPESHHTTMSNISQPVASAAQVHLPEKEPDRQNITKTQQPIDRIDDIIVPKPEIKSTADVVQKVYEEGHVTHLDQKWEPTNEVKTTKTMQESDVIERNVTHRDDERIRTVQESNEEEEMNKVQMRQKIKQAPVQKEPEVTKQTKQTVSAEGWVQHTHDNMAQPTTQVVRKIFEEEYEDKTANQRHTIIPGEKKITDETIQEDKNTQIRQQAAPQTTTRVTTTTTAEGAVQHFDDKIAEPVQIVEVKTRKQLEEEEEIRRRKDISTGGTKKIVDTTTEEDLLRQRLIETRQQPKTQQTTSTTTTTTSLIQKDGGRPIVDQTEFKTTETKEGYTRSVDEQSTKQRDSYILASDAEGFWTDGAYTASPTPPPVPKHQTIVEETYTKEIGESQSASAPEFFRSFQNEYTVDEGGRLIIEAVLVGKPKPRVRFFFNDQLIRTETTQFLQVIVTNDTYSMIIQPARLSHSGYYKLVAENIRGSTETLTVVHVRPLSLLKESNRREEENNMHIVKRSKPTEHTTVTTEFAMFEYEQRRPQKHPETSKLTTPPPAKRLQTHRRNEEHLERYELDEHRAAGHPPHFTQTLVSAVSADGESAKFEGIVTGWPAPIVEWTKDGQILTRSSLPDIQISNIGGRVSLTFQICSIQHSGKYMCTAKNSSGVATSSAQLVVRPKTIAPDFVQRLISEEVEEGEQLKWTVRVTGDPKPKLTWLRDGVEIPDCEEVRLIDEGNGCHSLIIMRVETADSGQFTCLAENVAGEARSTADLVVREAGTQPGSYFHVTKVTQEKQVKGEEPIRNSALSIEKPRQSAML